MRHIRFALPVLCFAAALSAQDTGYIKARGNVDHAAMYVNGNYVGPAYRFGIPEKYAVKAGEVELTFREPRYQDTTVKATITPGKTTKVHYTMTKLPVPEPPFGRLRLGGGEPESFLSVAAGDTGAVYLNDRYYGYVDELNDAGGGILLKPGTYTLHVVSTRFGDFQRQVTITANKVTVVPLTERAER
jgi:hypothetical protein